MISFRVDDFPYTKPDETWRHNLHSFGKFDAVMKKHGRKYTLGVIPTKLDLQMIEYLKTLPHVDLALHGVKHDERFPNEFREHQTSHDIYDSLRSAKALLDTIGGPVDVYIPPHNVIDDRTVTQLLALGFKKIWGGPETDPTVLDYARSVGIETERHVRPFYGRSDEMSQQFLGKWLNEHQDADYTIGLHWTWEVNIGLEHLDRFLSGLR